MRRTISLADISVPIAPSMNAFAMVHASIPRNYRLFMQRVPLSPRRSGLR
jgi:hypothetical protein